MAEEINQLINSEYHEADGGKSLSFSTTDSELHHLMIEQITRFFNTAQILSQQSTSLPAPAAGQIEAPQANTIDAQAKKTEPKTIV